MISLDPAGCAMFLVTAFALAGCAQAVWLGSAASRRFAWPIDGGRTFRRRRLLGDNKTVAGFLILPAATGLAFLTISLITSDRVPGLWPLTHLEYAALGVLAGLGCMAGELPNSFLKRQLDIAPGAPASGPITGRLFPVIDRLDSAIGVLAVVAATVSLPIAAAVYALAVGACLHLALSALTFRLGGKARAA